LAAGHVLVSSRHCWGRKWEGSETQPPSLSSHHHSEEKESDCGWKHGVRPGMAGASGQQWQDPAQVDTVIDAAWGARWPTVAQALGSGFPVQALHRHRHTTLLHIAATHGHLPTVQQLLTLGAHPDAWSRAGWTPVMYAVGYSGPEVLGALLGAGAEVNAASDDGLTPAFLVVLRGREPGAADRLRLLLEHAGLNLDTQYCGLTLEATARREGHVRLADMVAAEVRRRPETPSGWQLVNPPPTHPPTHTPTQCDTLENFIVAISCRLCPQGVGVLFFCAPMVDSCGGLSFSPPTPPYLCDRWCTEQRQQPDGARPAQRGSMPWFVASMSRLCM
jgi:hypothetical protein